MGKNEGGRKKSEVRLLGRLLVTTPVTRAMEFPFPYRKRKSLYFLTLPGCCWLKLRTVASVNLALGIRASSLPIPAPAEASAGGSELYYVGNSFHFLSFRTQHSPSP